MVSGLSFFMEITHNQVAAALPRILESYRVREGLDVKSMARRAKVSYSTMRKWVGSLDNRFKLNLRVLNEGLQHLGLDLPKEVEKLEDQHHANVEGIDEFYYQYMNLLKNRSLLISRLLWGCGALVAILHSMDVGAYMLSSNKPLKPHDEELIHNVLINVDGGWVVWIGAEVDNLVFSCKGPTGNWPPVKPFLRAYLNTDLINKLTTSRRKVTRGS